MASVHRRKISQAEVIRQISRLDLRAQFIVKGFLQGLHASPFHGFSVEFSEHRKYTPGDDPKDIDWLVYAKTDKYYVKKFEAETNITGYLVMDLSSSMGYTYRQELTKFDYAICLAAALCYLMVHQQDPVGLITFDEQIRESLPAKSKRTQLGNVLSLLGQPEADGQDRHRQQPDANRGDVAAPQPGHAVFSDLLADPEPCCNALRRLRHRGHDVILFHILDEAEVTFPFDGMSSSKSPRRPSGCKSMPTVFRHDYLASNPRFPRFLPPALLSTRHRLRAARYEHAVRPGADGVFVEPKKSMLSKMD